MPVRFAGLLVLSLAFHLLAVVFSVGHFGADEHYQILEFARWKLTGDPSSVSALVEFRDQMRPWMGPALAAGLIRFFGLFGIQNPTTWAMLLRGFAGTLGFLSQLVLLKSWFRTPEGLETSDRDRRMAWGVAFLFCYMPVFHARFSSEGLAASFIALGLAAISELQSKASGGSKSRERLLAAATGAAFAMAFEFRFQAAIAALGCAAWWLYQPRISKKLLWSATLGAVTIFAFGRGIDSWGYGAWVFTPWQYVKTNFLSGYFESFGRQPFWHYFVMSFTETWPPFGTLLLVGSIAGVALRPRSVLAWVFLPFFVAHCFMGFKALRFLFPLIPLAPLLLVPVFAVFKTTRLIRVLWGMLMVWNAIALAALSLAPASRGTLLYAPVATYLASHPDQKTIYWWGGEEPYAQSGGWQFFYRPVGVALKKVATCDEYQTDFKPREPRESQTSLTGESLFWISAPRVPSACTFGCRKLASTLPLGVEWVTSKIPGLATRLREQSVWACH